MAAFTTSMVSARRCPIVFFDGMGHTFQSILAAKYTTPAAPPGNGVVLVVTTHCGYLETIPDKDKEACKHDKFAAVVHIKAPMVMITGGDARRRPLPPVVTAKEVYLEVECKWPDRTTITAVKSGVYTNSNDRHEAWVDVDELYAGEERRFLFFFDVQRDEEDGRVVDDYVDKRLIVVRCSYIDVATEQQICVKPCDEYMDELRSTEVEKERHRVEAADDVALAHVAAERSDFAKAARILAARRKKVASSAAAVSGDAACEALAAELDELRRRVADEGEYMRTGRECLLASKSVHAQQRGSSAMLATTPAMRKMEELWEMQRLRQREAAPTTTPAPMKNGGSKDAPPSRSRLEARLAAAAPRISMLSAGPGPRPRHGGPPRHSTTGHGPRRHDGRPMTRGPSGPYKTLATLSNRPLIHVTSPFSPELPSHGLAAATAAYASMRAAMLAAATRLLPRRRLLQHPVGHHRRPGSHCAPSSCQAPACAPLFPDRQLPLGAHSTPSADDGLARAHGTAGHFRAIVPLRHGQDAGVPAAHARHEGPSCLAVPGRVVPCCTVSVPSLNVDPTLRPAGRCLPPVVVPHQHMHLLAKQTTTCDTTWSPQSSSARPMSRSRHPRYTSVSSRALAVEQRRHKLRRASGKAVVLPRTQRQGTSWHAGGHQQQGTPLIPPNLVEGIVHVAILVRLPGLLLERLGHEGARERPLAVYYCHPPPVRPRQYPRRRFIFRREQHDQQLAASWQLYASSRSARPAACAGSPAPAPAPCQRSNHASAWAVSSSPSIPTPSCRLRLIPSTIAAIGSLKPSDAVQPRTACRQQKKQSGASDQCRRQPGVQHVPGLSASPRTTRDCPLGAPSSSAGAWASSPPSTTAPARRRRVESSPPAKAAAGNGVLVVTTHCEYLATTQDEDDEACKHDTFAAMVHVKAPTVVGDEEARRTPLDLVAVLDVSASMSSKLEEAKRAMELVVDGLGPRDRLSVVAFSDVVRRVLPLTRMSEDGKATAKLAVESLVAGEGSTTEMTKTNIRAGLDEAAKVVKECRRRNNVDGVILLSDGHDHHSSSRRRRSRRDTTDARKKKTDYYSDLVPLYLVEDGGQRSTPVHTFAFGSDHDEVALHGISSATRGTFTFVEDNNLQDAMARCVGGLRSVTAQDVSIEVECDHLDLTITAVKSGVYKNDVNDDEGVSVSVGELYADEERRFLFFLDAPRDEDDEDDGGDVGDYVGSRLIAVRCSYRHVATEQDISVEAHDEYMDKLTSTEVKKERHRVDAADDVALAHAAAERGDFAEAARILAARREKVTSSAAAVAGDVACEALAAELDELRRRTAEEGEYRRTGRASLLASMRIDDHQQQG
ncbi:hypothetical protein HU200_050990 [Digitaria exilis]|uniref:VWFA domain-containing protein n=1 Tax=Digitaria exilis TaxID=1010633 RepID=A0A835E599_9POAL|nr:hypothetical protein HU200_050990 [Digitaria exilis]